jgi:hypothetical protein
MHYLKAVKEAGTDATDAVAAQMKKMKINDPMTEWLDPRRRSGDARLLRRPGQDTRRVVATLGLLQGHQYRRCGRCRASALAQHLQAGEEIRARDRR